jgi:acyl carrier protein
MSQEEESRKKRWTKAEVETALKEILIDALDVDEGRVVPDASLVYDLGAESIDFLDIGFRVQQMFGVELPNKAIQDRALNWRNLSGLHEILEGRYGAKVTREDVKKFQTMGIPEVLSWLEESQGIAVKNGDAEVLAGELSGKLAREVESIGFKASLIEQESITKLLLENLNSPQILEGMLRLFRVGALVDFITTRVGEETQSGSKQGIADS